MINFKFFLKKFFTNANTNTANQQMPMRLKKKFYKTVEIAEVKNANFKEIDPTPSTQLSPIEKLLHLSTPKEYFYHILLDSKKCKSMYLDELKIPNKKLALLLAEEWAQQKDFVNLHAMQLNFFASSGIRISKEESLRNDVIKTLSDYIESDQLVFIEDKIAEYITEQEAENVHELIEKIIFYMYDNFGIELRRDTSFGNIGTHNSSNKENREKFQTILKEFDPWVLAILEQLIGLTKSPSISIALLTGVINPRQAYLLSHAEEYFQMKINGEVEGHHDISNEMIMGKFYSAICFHNSVYL
jgi:chaperone required for assembly of F1-ATPase